MLKQSDSIQLLADARLALKIATEDVIKNKEHFDGMDHAKEVCADKFEEELKNVKQRIAGISKEDTPSTGPCNK